MILIYLFDEALVKIYLSLRKIEKDLIEREVDYSENT